MLFYFLIIGFLIASQAKEPKFEIQEIDNKVSIGYGIAIGDVDGDGKPDILLVDKDEIVWYRNGDWKRFVMVKNLTEHDNVCIAARDINGDGKMEVAVGAQWNPGETSDPEQSGSVHFLIRPEDPTKRWTPVQLHHEPTVHRMRWAKAKEGTYHLIMVPLHGRGNKGGEGQGVKIIAYEMPEDPTQEWNHWVIDQSMHLTHNLDLFDEGGSETLYIGGKEGVKALSYQDGEWLPHPKGEWIVQSEIGFGELRMGKSSDNHRYLTGIEPIHGHLLTIYESEDGKFSKDKTQRTVLAEDLKGGHGLASADLLGSGRDQIVVGWREPNEHDEIGIRLYFPQNDRSQNWEKVWVDKNGMACEDLQVADLDGDGKLDIIASGRSTHNLKIYWNKSN